MKEKHFNHVTTFFSVAELWKDSESIGRRNNGYLHPSRDQGISKLVSSEN